MEVQVEVSENDILKVNLKDEADIEVDAYLGRKFKGKVTEIANSASNVTSLAGAASLNTDQVTNFVVKIRVDPTSYSELMGTGKQYPFRPGMSAAVDIYTNAADSTLSVPLIAVTAREQKEEKDKKPEAKEVSKKEEDDDEIKEIVFVVTGDTVAVREVKTGIQDNDFIEVLSGLQEGETVVTGPYSAVARKLKSGARITVTDKKKEDKDKKGGASVEVD
jgi:HlyD family secretion protein